MKSTEKIVLAILTILIQASSLFAGNEVIDLNLSQIGSKGIVRTNFQNRQPDSNGVLKTYRVLLPPYSNAIYYAQDTYYDYFQVNGNRVLPWIFTPQTLGTLFTQPAYGVDDEKHPQYKNAGFKNRTRYVARSGNYIQMLLQDNRVISMLPLSNDATISDFYVTQENELTLRVATYGTESITGIYPVFAWAIGDNINESSYKLFEMLEQQEEYKNTLRLRYQKKYPEPFEYLGWCTWEEYKKDIDAQLLAREIDKLKHLDLPIRFVIIDDGHLCSRSQKGIKNQLTSFSANPKFPKGFSSLLKMRNPSSIRWMGLWKNFNGYWGGFSPENDFGKEINACLQTIEKSGYTMPKNDLRSIEKVYDAYLGCSAKEGFDFLKVDWQAANLHMQRYSGNAAKGAFLTSRVVDNISHKYYSDAMINCMAMNNAVLQNTYYTNVTRTSIDYKLNNLFMAKEHLLQAYHNALYMCPTIWGDHDMFHSSDKVCGKTMAISKALSGGPVYLSDAPEEINSELVTPLCYQDGTIIRPLAPATVSQRSAFTSPLVDRVPYYVSAPLSNKVSAVAAYNLTVDSTTVYGSIDYSDYCMTGTLMQPYQGQWDIPTEGLFVYDCNLHTGCAIGKSKYTFVLTNFEDKLFFLIPIHQGWAIIGRTDKYLAPATITQADYSAESITVTLAESGTFDFWMQEGTPFAEDMTFVQLGNGIWRANIPADTSKKQVTIYKKQSK